MKNIFSVVLMLCASLAFAQQNKVAQNKEYIDWKAAKINGAVSMEGAVAKLYSALSKPDSIVKPNMNDVCSSFYSKPFKYVYIKGNQFELYGKNAVVRSLNFKNNKLKLIAGKLTLDGNTTIASLAKIFPMAIKKRYPLTIEHNKKVMAIQLSPSKAISEDTWLLFFENGRLIRIDYHINC
jgi:hypothetical protein